MSITVTDIISQYGQKYLNSGQSQADIYKTFKRTRTLPSFATARMTDNTVAQLSMAFMTNVLQPFQTTYSHKGNLTLIANEIRLREIKIDQLINPDSIEDTWAGFMADKNNAERQQWPIVRWIWEVLIAEQAQQDYEGADWAGSYLAASGGTPGSHLDIYDGLKKQLIAGLANSGNPMHTLHMTEDPMDSTKVFDNIEYVVSQLPQFWVNRPVDIYVPQRMHLNYFRDRRNKHGNDYGRQNQLNDDTMVQPIAVDGRPTWRLVPFGGMDMNSDYGWVFAAPRANVLHYTRSNSWRMGMDKVDRTAKVYADWWEGLGIAVNDLTYVFNGVNS